MVHTSSNESVALFHYPSDKVWPPKRWSTASVLIIFTHFATPFFYI